MKIILAQGNPESKFKGTRHNVGFEVLDSFAESHGVSFTDKSKFFAYIAELSIKGEKVLLVKPTTYYNETGKCGRALIDFYKLSPTTDLLVVHDDLALPLGTLRIREKGSSAGNNGIKSLNAHLGEGYHRLRIGIYNDLREKIDDFDFVLARFTKAEDEVLKKTVIPKCEDIISDFITERHDVTSFNTLTLA